MNKNDLVEYWKPGVQARVLPGVAGRVVRLDTRIRLSEYSVLENAPKSTKRAYA
jgi:hypothetical protein